MAQRAAIVTGGSSGIGLAIARMLVQEGYGVTIASRRPEKLAEAAQQLSADGGEVAQVAGNMASEEVVAQVVAEHRERFGRLDVLVNNAGVGVGALVADIETKRLHAAACDVDPLRSRGRRASRGCLPATKAAVVAHRGDEQGLLGTDGIKSTALCPAFVDTPMTDFIKQNVAAEDMIQVTDVSEAVRMCCASPPAA